MWGNFLTKLESVAVKCGVHFVKVSAYGTSQNCSSCGQKVPKDLRIRIHNCPHCGYVADRDLNASLNIWQKGLNAVSSHRISLWRLRGYSAYEARSLIKGSPFYNETTLTHC